MKNTIKIITLLFIVLFVSCLKPIDYYNKAVYAGNANPLQEIEYKIERLQQGYSDGYSNLKQSVDAQVTYQQTQLEELKEFIGNAESGQMVKSAYTLLENGINTAKAERTQELIEIINNAKSIEELEEDLVPLQKYYNEIYDKKEALYKAYEEAITAYADANNIEMTFYGPGIIPGVNDTRKKS